jgi:hypothetical protein
LIANTENAFSFDLLDTLDICKAENLFQQFASKDCLEYCPTGSILGSFPKICGAVEGELSTAIFTLITDFPMEWHEWEPFRGRYRGGAVDLIRGPADPIFLPFRGLYFDGNDDFMRFTDFIFSGSASIAVVMKKPLASVGTLFSLDTASLLNAELAISFEGPGSEIRVYMTGKDKLFNLSINTDNWIVLGFSWSWSNGNMNFNLSIDNEVDMITIEDVPPYMDTLIS